MRTDSSSKENSAQSLMRECGIFQHNIESDTCLSFGALNTEVTPFSTSPCDGAKMVSIKMDLGGHINDTCSRTGRETDEENVYVDCDNKSIAPEEQTTHYAEILTTKPCSSTVSISRRTRESSNPILRVHYDRELLNTDDRSRKSDVSQSRDDSVLYENTTKHTKIHHSASDSEIHYANIGHDAELTQDNSHHYENSTKHLSVETSDSESLYEDIGEVYEVMTPRVTASQPINIVYASVDFSKPKRTPVSSVGSCSFSSSMGSLERSELTRCSSCASMVYPSPSPRKPPELPQRQSFNARPASLHFGNRVHDLTEFGMFTGTLVGSCTVTKNSPKSIQHVVADFLAREKKDHSKPVSLEVNNEFLRLSLNCAPWNLLAQNSVDDIGCVTTVSANNKTALGYTISKPGESTRCYVIHCSDVDAIKEAILTTFKRPDPSLPRWSSMSVLSGSKSRSLTRTRSMPRHNEIAIFDELVYLGSYKVKKSYLVVNDNITSVLDHTDSKTYTLSNIELYKDAIHLKDSAKDRILDIHQLDWILSMGLFDEDRRYFGYISSKAYQGCKTRTFCHVFRCNRVGLASRILESIRQACQATFLARTPENEPYRSRVNSNASSSSEGSISSSSETMSHDSTSSSPTSEQDKAQNANFRERVKRRSRFRKSLSTFRSYIEEKRTSDIPEEKEEPEVQPKPLVYRFNVFYLISTILSPPLKPKHVKNCLKQYQKSVDKEMKKTGNVQHYKKVQLFINEKGITIIDAASNTPQAFFERGSLAGVQGHPEGKCAFAFSTAAGGNAKHKCHLFLQDKEHMDEIIKVIQSQIY